MDFAKILTLGVFDYKLVQSILYENILDKLDLNNQTTESSAIELEENQKIPKTSTSLTKPITDTGGISSTVSPEFFQRCVKRCGDALNSPTPPNVFCCPPGILPPSEEQLDPGPLPIQNGNDCECGKQQSDFNACKETAILMCANPPGGIECTPELLNSWINTCYIQALNDWIKQSNDAACCNEAMIKYDNCMKKCKNFTRGRVGKPGYEDPWFNPEDPNRYRDY